MPAATGTLKYWREPVTVDGRELSAAEAMSQFVDAIGQPGPAGWEAGTYAAGEENLPVTGVSWYEAAAYAAWAGKSLPTIFQWNRVAFTCASAQIIALANLAGRALVPVGSTHSMNRFGVRDLAGNVREWTANRTAREDTRFLLGGGWNDPEYSFNDAWAQPPLDRSPTNGFRCIRHVEPEPNLERSDARDRHAVPRLPRGDAGAGRGVRVLPAAVSLRPVAARREDRGGRADRDRAHADGHVRRRLRWRADDGARVPARRRPAHPIKS